MESYLDGKVRLHRGDCLEVLPTLAGNSLDACVTDPPYGLQFMGREWDKLWRNETEADQAYVERTNGQLTSRARKLPDYKASKPGQMQEFHLAWAKEVYRVLKPGAHLLAFSGTRTYHRMACAIEDAGFEIRDQIGWCYGSGFPKSHSIPLAIDKLNGFTPRGRAFNYKGDPDEKYEERVFLDQHQGQCEASIHWQGWGTALKPAFEPVVLAQKPYTPQEHLAILVPTIGELIWQVVSFGKMVTPLSGSVPVSGFLSTVTLLSSYLAALWGRESTFTTETAIALTTDLRILKSLLSKIIPACTTGDRSLTSGGESDVLLAESISRSALAKCERLACTTAGEIAIDWLASEGSGPGGARIAPAWEPIVLARKPISEASIAANVLKWGTGALNIDGCRVGTEGGTRAGGNIINPMAGGFGPGSHGTCEPIDAGRWPANIITDGSDEVMAAFPTPHGAGSPSSGTAGANPDNWRGNVFAHGGRGLRHGDEGSAARFFYTAKADSDDRLGSKHPTVKPLDLLQYLVRLVTPRAGCVLDPFAGTGTTGEASFREGFRAVLVEREEEYQADIVKRMSLCLSGPTERQAKSTKQVGLDGLPLFGQE